MVESWLVVEAQVNKILYRPKNFLRCFVFFRGADGIGECSSLHPDGFKVRYKKVVHDSKSRNHLTEVGLF